MCFRLLHTLHHCGLLEKVDASRYRLVSEIRRRKRYRIGYAAQGQDSSFAREVLAGLQRAAERDDVELIVVNNRYQPKVALRNAEHLVREHADLVIEFQTDEAAAPAIASKYLEVLLVELARAGSLVHARMSGVLAGLKEVLREAVEGLRHPRAPADRARALHPAPAHHAGERRPLLSQRLAWATSRPPRRARVGSAHRRTARGGRVPHRTTWLSTLAAAVVRDRRSAPVA